MLQMNEKMPVALLFDLDGTLIHSLPDLAAGINAVLTEEGRAALSVEAVGSMVGNGVEVLVERVWKATGTPAGEDLPSLVERYLAHYNRDPVALTRPYPGVVETLSQLADAGHPLAVVTNKPEASTRLILDRLDLTRLFGAVIGGDTTPHLKPHPEPLHEAQRRLGVDHAVMVGDSPADIGAARAAGVPSVAVTYGYRTVSLEALGGDRQIETFAALPEALGGLFSG